jgi:uncharacterized coiled-coil DUF342 family protein
MKLRLTTEERKNIRDIIDEYRLISDEIDLYQKKADEIQEKVITLNSQLKDIKDEEDKLMTELHNKYGDFSLQDIYDIVVNDKFL